MYTTTRRFIVLCSQTCVGRQSCVTGAIVAAAGLWAGAGVDTRPKYRDEQTLIGGTIWSQLIIPIGLLISTCTEEVIGRFVHGYFMLSGVAICGLTGIVLLTGEYKAMKRFQRHSTSQNLRVITGVFKYDRIYLSIGILSLLAGFFTLANFTILLVFVECNRK